MRNRLSRGLSLAFALLLVPAVLLAADAEPVSGAFHDPNAVLVNLTEADLNTIVLDTFHALGGPDFVGKEKRVSSTMSGLYYAARFSEPVVDLGPGGTARLRVDLQQAQLRVEEVEAKLIGARIRCEGVGATLDREQALDIALDLDLVLDGGDVRIVPRAAELSDARRAFHLVKPRCSQSPVPTFLLWWLGKSRLQKKLDDLDELLLEGVRRSAADLDRREDGILHKRVSIGEHELIVYPRLLETGHESIWVALGATSEAEQAETRDASIAPPPGLEATRGGSWLAVSERVINEMVGLAYGDWSRPAARPRGTLRKVFESPAVLTLVPGLRNVADRDNLTWGVRLRSVPRIDFREERGRPLIELRLSGIEIEIGRGDEVLGTLNVDRGVVAAVPQASPLGGITLDLVRNDWDVSSTGIAFDEPLLAGTIQELIFGELFETRYEPLARGALTVGDTRFEPTGFDVVDGYLVMSFAHPGARPAAPTRTDSPLASR